MTELSVFFGEKLREKRIQAGLTQQDLSHRAQLDRSFISRAERGLCSISLDSLYKIAGILECSPAELLPEPSQLK